MAAYAARITIKNWKFYQGEGMRYDSTSWFRLENDVWEHKLWDELDGDEFKAMVFLWCRVSQLAHKTGSLILVLRSASRMSGVSEPVFERALLKLEKPLNIATIEFISAEQAEGFDNPPPPVENAESASGSPAAGNGAVTGNAPGAHGADTGNEPGMHPAYDHDHNNDHEKNKYARSCDRASSRSGRKGKRRRKKSNPAFDEVYEKYPRHVGRARGDDLLSEIASDAAEMARLSRAVTNYRAYVERLDYDEQHIKQWDTFAEEWEDWVEERTGTCNVIPIQKNASGKAVREIVYFRSGENIGWIYRDEYDEWQKRFEAGRASGRPPPLCAAPDEAAPS